MSPKRGSRPESKGVGKVKAPAPEPKSYEHEHPIFCLRYLQPAYDLSHLDKRQQAAFAMTLQKLSSVPWSELRRGQPHALGWEMLPAERFVPSPPEGFKDAPSFMVFRYDGKLPMAGVRFNQVFHALWIERWFNELYPHGS